MQLDSTTTGDKPVTNSRHRQKITIKSDRLKKVQQLHALAINVIPLLGSIVATAIAWQLGITLIEVEMLLGMYVLTQVGITVGFHRHFTHRAF